MMSYKVKLFMQLIVSIIFQKSFCQITEAKNSTYRIKPAISFENSKNWPSVDEGVISNDGSIIGYKVYKWKGENKLIIQSTLKNWRHEFIDGTNLNFSNDSRFIAFITGQDTLNVLDINGDSLFKIPKVIKYEFYEIEGKVLICYVLNGNSNELDVKNLSDGINQSYPSVISYQPIRNSPWFIIQSFEQKMDKKYNKLRMVNLNNNAEKILFSTGDEDIKVHGYSVNNEKDKIAFCISSNNETEIWGYNLNNDSLFLIANNSLLKQDKEYKISNLRSPKFSEDGRFIFFGIDSIENSKINQDYVPVDIWSYKDKTLQSIQLIESKKGSVYTCVINIEAKKYTRLEYEDDNVIGSNSDFVLIKHDLGNYGLFETNWNEKAKFSFYLVSLKDGMRKLLRKGISNPYGNFAISPTGKWILYFDFNSKQFFSYEMNTGITRNITKDCKTNWCKENNDRPELELNWVPWRNTWLANDTSVLIYDNYDIWQIDPQNKNKPINITNGFGKKNKIKFELLFEDINNKYTTGNTIYLKAINSISKERGFYSVVIGKTNSLRKCYMGPYVFGPWQGYDTYNYPPIKSKNYEKYLVLRMSATEAPNYYLTEDFKEFKVITDFQPQRVINWLKTELVKWKNFDGATNYGIIYKPEDFNPNKKYPIIFDCYEKRSDELNLFIYPKASQGRINIPWFVSNGFLVFTPDINYKEGFPGLSAYNAVVSAANILKKFNWVDKNKMGIQGHSFGGFETDYIITHTNIFAAACSASGYCDLISFYGSGARGSYPIYWSERNQGRLGNNIWEIPQQYITNSPIFRANKISTPLLMMNNKSDRTVPFDQGVEFFTSLRRLGKMVWMLQYDNEGHYLEPGPAAKDFHLRMLQFFNYYLKGYSQPVWMKYGISAKNKGLENGFNLDN